MIKIHFLGASRLFVRLQIQIQRLDFTVARPRAGALSWACVSGRTWLADKRCGRHPDELSHFQSLFAHT